MTKGGRDMRAIAPLTVAILLMAYPALADIILLKDGQKKEAYIEAAGDDEGYVLILPDGSEEWVAEEDVETILEVAPLPIIEAIERLESRVRNDEDDTVAEELIAFRSAYPNIGATVRGRLAAMLRDLGARFLEKGDPERAMGAYRDALKFLPGDREALGQIQKLQGRGKTARRRSTLSYSPLQPGARWTYEEEAGERTRRILSVEAKEDGVLEAEVEDRPDRMGGGKSRTYTWVHDAQGLREIGGGDRRLLAEPLEVGTRWSEQEEMFVLTYEYVALKEKVVVPAGTYSECIKVRITAETIPYRVEPVVYYRYYALGVGLVKTERAGGRLQALKEYTIEE